MKMSEQSNRRLDNLKLKVRSETLEEINVVNMNKARWCDEVVCPSLKKTECRGHQYGNGIRRLVPVGHAYNNDDLNVIEIENVDV